MGVNAQRLREKKPYLGSRSTRIVCNSNVPVIIAHYDEEFKGVMSEGEKQMIVPPTPVLPDDVIMHAQRRLSDIRSTSKEISS